MEDRLAVDVIIESVTEEDVARIEDHFRELDPERTPATRDPVTVLAVTAGAVALTKSIIDLWTTLHKDAAVSPRIPVIVEVESGATLDLHIVGSPAEIEAFCRKETGR